MRRPRPAVVVLLMVVLALGFAAPAASENRPQGPDCSAGCGRLEVSVQFHNDQYSAELSVFDADDAERMVTQDVVNDLDPVATFDVRPGRYKVRLNDTVWSGGVSHATARAVTVRAGEKGSVLIPRNRRLGHVVEASDPSGEVLPALRLNIRSSDDPAQIIRAITWEGEGIGTAGVPNDVLIEVVDLTGTFRPRSVPLGDRLRTSLDLYPVDGARRVGARTGSAAEIRGHVDLPDSRNLDAYLYRADRWSGRLQWATVYSPEGYGSRNNLRFTELSSGTYKIQLSDGRWYGGSSFATATPIPVGPDQVVTLDDAEVGNWGTVAGVVRNERGARLDGVLVTVYPEGQQDPVSRQVTEGIDSMRFPGTGFVLDFLPPGGYQIRVSDVAGRIVPRWVGGGASRSSAQTIRPVDGELVTLPDVTVLTGLRATSTPRVLGRARVGGTLRATRSTWSVPDVLARRQWTRDGRPIRGASAPTYRITRADRDHSIGFVVNGRAEGRPAAKIVSKTVRVPR